MILSYKTLTMGFNNEVSGVGIGKILGRKGKNCKKGEKKGETSEEGEDGFCGVEYSA